MNKEKYNYALNRAMALCSRYEKCVKDITEKLSAWGIDDETATGLIIEELIKNKFIDERRYAAGYAREKQRINRWGKIKIRAMLKAKGIDRLTIEEALANIDPVEYSSILKEDLIRKRSSIRSSGEYELKGKLIRFAQSRGYETDLIFSAIAELFENSE